MSLKTSVKDRLKDFSFLEKSQLTAYVPCISADSYHGKWWAVTHRRPCGDAHHRPSSQQRLRGAGGGGLVKAGEGWELKALSLKKWEKKSRKHERMKNGNKERGGSRKLGCVPGSISPLLSTPSWAATFSHLFNIINEKAFRCDGGPDSKFRLWPPPADTAETYGLKLEWIGCPSHVQRTACFMF